MNVNLQKVRVVIDGKVRRIKVSTKAIRSGLIERPSFTYKPRQKRVYEVSAMETAARAKAAVVEDESQGLFFSSGSVVDRVFEKKKKKDTDDDRRMTLEQAELEEFEYGGNFGKVLAQEDFPTPPDEEDLGEIPEPPPEEPEGF